MKRVFLAGFLLLIVTVAGCSGNATGNTVAGPVRLANNYHEFDKASYENALSEGKYIFLEFHADWCSICRAEAPNIKAAFNELENEDIVGFQVNYNDGRTTSDERALAKKLSITYQSTKVILSPDGNVLSRDYRGPASKDTIKRQIQEAISQ